MSILRNLLGNFMPHFESRRTSGTITTNGGEVVHDVDGDESATIYFKSNSLHATYNFQGSVDGVDYFDLVAYPYSTASAGGIPPQAAQPVVSETLINVIQSRLYCVAVGGLRKIRVRFTAHVNGFANIIITSDACASISPYVRDNKSATLAVTNTGAAAAAVTLTIPGVTGLRHYIDTIVVTRSPTVALTAAAVPRVVTTTNLPGSPALTFGSDAAGIGVDRTLELNFGGAGMAAEAAGVNTTVICPAYTGVIWRVNAFYRLGL